MAPVSMLFYLFIEMNHYQRGYKKKESKHLINSDPIFKLDFKRTILANQLIILISCFTTFSFFFFNFVLVCYRANQRYIENQSTKNV